LIINIILLLSAIGKFHLINATEAVAFEINLLGISQEKHHLT